MFSSSCSSQDNNGVERTFGDCAVRKKYSHIDLIHMIDGVETQKATICAGNRCYYLKVRMVYTYMTLYVQGTCMYLRHVGSSIEVENNPQKLCRRHHPIVS